MRHYNLNQWMRVAEREASRSGRAPEIVCIVQAQEAVANGLTGAALRYLCASLYHSVGAEDALFKRLERIVEERKCETELFGSGCKRCERAAMKRILDTVNAQVELPSEARKTLVLNVRARLVMIVSADGEEVEELAVGEESLLVLRKLVTRVVEDV